MSGLDQDVEKLQNAIRLFVQSVKNPQQWSKLTSQAGINIDRPSAIILRILESCESGHIRVQDLAHELGIEPPSVTRKTQLLEELGYVTRRPDPNDKRAVSIKITRDGRKISQKLWKAQRQYIADALKAWPDKDRHQLANLFERFSRDLNKTN